MNFLANPIPTQLPVLVSCGCHNKLIQTRGLKITEMYWLTVLEAKSLKSGHQQAPSFLTSSSCWHLLAIPGIGCLIDASLTLFIPFQLVPIITWLPSFVSLFHISSSLLVMTPATLGVPPSFSMMSSNVNNSYNNSISK